MKDYERHTSKRPAGVGDDVFQKYRATAIRKLSSWFWRPWRTTVTCECPGWVLREMAAAGEVEFRKPAAGAPNEWRLAR